MCEGVIVIAYENGDPAHVHHLTQEICEAYWLEWLMRLQQYKNKFPEHFIHEAVSRVNEAEQELTHVPTAGSVATSLHGKSLKSIGVPVESLGTVVKDEDVIEEDKEISSKETFEDSLSSRIIDSWKQIWKNVFDRIRSRRKDS